MVAYFVKKFRKNKYKTNSNFVILRKYSSNQTGVMNLMNKYMKLLGSLLIVIASITTLAFGLNSKDDSKAADFPHNLTNENNGSDFRGGALS
ncbi:hypothetical protein KIMC2_17720 [Xylocopilactobacillus apis]|uniref:Uncharacterized protein n=2 Tax=Xylocopilactobacillus apis TaxID=2932183 RepID=A0AAU9DBS2_9LACO|nr:hypothetical protein KIMC2_17720 [Xylocopilactobacillus apis]